MLANEVNLGQKVEIILEILNLLGIDLSSAHEFTSELHEGGITLTIGNIRIEVEQDSSVKYKIFVDDKFVSGFENDTFEFQLGDVSTSAYLLDLDTVVIDNNGDVSSIVEITGLSQTQ